ncbi:hypothetical protein L484_027100 [Morus notabilis]|uniref:Secreted protein n=1 Tax=Morus notabilis TaxID=981085 RepID=W9SQ54_9ROSA|nr:hypothetical protein L484_027100 [Morus notabilis]
MPLLVSSVVVASIVVVPTVDLVFAEPPLSNQPLDLISQVIAFGCSVPTLAVKLTVLILVSPCWVGLQRRWLTQDLEMTDLVVDVIDPHSQGCIDVVPLRLWPLVFPLTRRGVAAPIARCRVVPLLGLHLRGTSALLTVILTARLPYLFLGKGCRLALQGLLSLLGVDELLCPCQEFLVSMGWSPVAVCAVGDVLLHTRQRPH